MCGIVGIITTDLDSAKHPVESFFRQALFADTLRGPHSTGIFAANTFEDDVFTFKKAMSAPDFLDLTAVDNIISPPKWTWNVMVGHNRYATKGGVSNKTAHPFTYDHITLVHNGTLHYHHDLAGATNLSVDSEAICKAFSLEDPAKVIEELEGSFALVWYNSKENTVNFVRNDDRPLSFAKVKGFDTILLASEVEMLKWLAGRNSLPLESVATPKPGELFSFSPAFDDKDWIKNQKVKTVKIKESYEWPNYGGYSGGNYKSSSSNGNMGKSITTYQQPSQAQQDLSEKLGLKYKDEIVIIDHKFIEYPGAPGKGRVEGKISGMETDENYRVEIASFPKEEYEAFFLSEDILTEIQYSYISYSQENKENILIVVADNKQYWILEDGSSGRDTDYPEDKDNIETVVRGPDGMLTVKEFEELTKHGCVYCQGNIYEEEADHIGWTHDKQPVCPDCIADYKFEKYVG